VVARKKRLEWNGMIARIMSILNMSKENNELSLDMEAIWMQIHECTYKHSYEKVCFSLNYKQQ